MNIGSKPQTMTYLSHGFFIYLYLLTNTKMCDIIYTYSKQRGDVDMDFNEKKLKDINGKLYYKGVRLPKETEKQLLKIRDGDDGGLEKDANNVGKVNEGMRNITQAKLERLDNLLDRYNNNIYLHEIMEDKEYLDEANRLLRIMKSDMY